jgi:flagellar biosynthetic protein FliR
MEIPTEVLAAFGLVLTRTSALVVVAPILGFGTGFSGYKIAFTFLLSLVIFTALAEPLPAEVPPVTYGAMMLRELLIGVFLGFTLQVVLLSVRVAGEMIGHEMGFLMARQADPVTGVPSTLITNVYETLFLLAILMLNGHHVLVRSLGVSFERAPIGRLALGQDMAPTVQAMFAEMFSAGIVFAAPVMIFLMLVSLLMGLLARAVPTLNVLEIGFTMRVIVALSAMYVFAPLLESSIANLHEGFIRWLGRGLDALA